MFRPIFLSKSLLWCLVLPNHEKAVDSLLCGTQTATETPLHLEAPCSSQLVRVHFLKINRFPVWQELSCQEKE